MAANGREEAPHPALQNAAIPNRTVCSTQSSALTAVKGREAAVQLAFLDPQKSPSPPWLPRLKPVPRTPLKPTIPFGGPYLGGILTLFSLLSELNDDEQQTIISFRSREFRHDGPERSFDFERLQTLTREEVAKVCGDHFKTIQELTDKVYKDVKKDKSLSPQQLGTEVHTRVEKTIKDLKKSDQKTDYENLEAELSFAKEDGDDRRGAKDTVRLDVYNRVDDKTLCIDDIKTGGRELRYSRMKELVLRYSRMKELVSAVSKKYPDIKRIIVTEVRPNGMRPPKPRAPTLQKD